MIPAFAQPLINLLTCSRRKETAVVVKKGDNKLKKIDRAKAKRSNDLGDVSTDYVSDHAGAHFLSGVSDSDMDSMPNFPSRRAVHAPPGLTPLQPPAQNRAHPWDP